MAYFELESPIGGCCMLRLSSMIFNQLYGPDEKATTIPIVVDLGEMGKKLKIPVMVQRPNGPKVQDTYSDDVYYTNDDGTVDTGKIVHKKGDLIFDEEGEPVMVIEYEESYDVRECTNLEKHGVVDNPKTFIMHESYIVGTITGEGVANILCTIPDEGESVYDCITKKIFEFFLNSGRISGRIIT